MRSHQVRKIGFQNLGFLMHAIEDDWGVDDVVTSEIAGGHYGEVDALLWWLAMLEREAPSVFFDIGSYTGLYSLVAAASSTAHRTAAIEASVVTYGRLMQNILLNGFDLRIVPCHLALSDKTEIVKLGHAFGPLSMASGESLEPDYDVDHFELVPSTSLDALALQEEPVRFGAISSISSGILPLQSVGGMKIDVEGVELAVLKGASEVIRRFRPPMIIEILRREKVALCEEMLLPAGYVKLAECAGQNHVYCHEADAARLQQAHGRLASQPTPAISSEVVLSYTM